jgi:rhodanese-related sulfurtransferase
VIVFSASWRRDRAPDTAPGRAGTARRAALPETPRRLALALVLVFGVARLAPALASGPQGPPQPRPVPGAIANAPAPRLDRAAVYLRFGRAGTTLLDVRPEAEWAAGHIPHSLPFPLAELRNGDGTMMSGADLAPILRGFGPRHGDPLNLDDTLVVVGTPPPGERVDPVAALRSAGVQNVLVYPGGFDDWRRSPCAPITRQVPTEELATLVRKAHGGRFRDDPARSLILIDLRYEREYAHAHLPGALLLPSGRFDSQIDSLLEARWPGIDRATTPIAVYCYGPDCIRSRIATTLAARHGFRQLLWYREGPQAWSNAGHPLFEGASTARR